MPTQKKSNRSRHPTNKSLSNKKRKIPSIDEVMTAHESTFEALPNFGGFSPEFDERLKRPVIRVLINGPIPSADQAPQELEGYPVVYVERGKARAISGPKTPQTIADELKLPVESVLKHLAGLNFTDLTAESPIEEQDYPPLLRAVRKRDEESTRDPDGEKRRRADAAFEKHGDALMMLPGVMGTWVDFDPKQQTYVIVIAVSQAPATIKGLPSELDGVPVTLDETGPITAA